MGHSVIHTSFAPYIESKRLMRNASLCGAYRSLPMRMYIVNSILNANKQKCSGGVGLFGRVELHRLGGEFG